MKIAIINGPNLNLLGVREPLIYGNETYDSFFNRLKEEFYRKNVVLDIFQSNIEGEIIDKLQTCGFDYDGIILNAAAYTHTSLGIGDTIKAIKTPVIEVHISNIWAREPFRHKSHTAPYTKGVIAGFGLDSYRLALANFLK